jgi:hypothetical protein
LIFGSGYSLAGLEPANHQFGLPPSDEKLNFPSVRKGRLDWRHRDYSIPFECGQV